MGFQEDDGSVDSTTQSPTYTYTTAGTYSVNLTVTGTTGTDSEIKASYITVTAAPGTPVAAFTANTTSGTAPLTVKFTDSSTGTGLSVWKWDFNNDKVIDSTSQSPTYTSPPLVPYTVNLTVTGTAGTDSEVKSNYITMTTAPFAPVANFITNVTSGTAPLTVKFTDSSTVPDCLPGNGISRTMDRSTAPPRVQTYTYSSAGTLHGQPHR